MKNRTRINNNRNGLLFALPWIIGFLAFSVYPLFSSLYYSFTQFNPVSPAKWVGLQNYRLMFQDPLFYKSLKNTFIYALVSTPVNLGIAMGLAALINKKFRGRGVARTIFFLPSVIPMVASTMVWIWMFDPTYGLINNTLSKFGIQGPSWLMDPHYTKAALFIIGAWCTGTTMLICMAALQDVPNSYYESAEIDGANAIVKFLKITLPCVAHVVVYQGILNLINAFQYFTQVNVILTASGGGSNAVASGGPENSILMYPLYLFYNAFTYMDMGRSCAMAWVLFIIVVLLTMLALKLNKRALSNGMGGE